MAILNMSFFDYGNTRLRARLSHLLSIRLLERLSETTNVDALLSALTKTAYQSVVEEAYATTHGLECVENALILDMVKIAEDLKKYYSDKSAEYMQLILNRYDLMNMMLILRGLIHHIPSAEIKRSLTFIGNIPNTILMNLAESLNVMDAINKMVSFQLPLSFPLMQLLREKKAITEEIVSYFLRQWYYRDLFSHLDLKDENARILSDVMKTEIDCTNLLAIFRWRISRNDVKLGINELMVAMIPDGHQSIQKLEHFANILTLKEMILSMRSLPYYSSLNQALLEYDHNKRLSTFENALDLYQAKKHGSLIKSNPLGIGVPIGFLSLKNYETQNLRWIAYGIHFGFDPQIIKDGMQRVM
jgi:vacuolar-type H+-ATPase subunit C/Vma6